MKRIGEHAIVIGASMGGLLAARALSDFYGNVTLLERDTLPHADVPRKGVPQARHAHGLLARGRDVIETFFPGWTDGVVACGGAKGDVAGDVSWIGHGVTLGSAPSDMIGLLASRPVFEGHVRRRLLELANVGVMEACAVQGLVTNDDRSVITGVRVKKDDGAEKIVTADLVVDASGRGSSTPAWLESLGYSRPEQERVEIGLCYTSRLYRRRPGDLGGKYAMVIASSAPSWRGGAVLFQTNDCWIVSLGGFLGDFAPLDDKRFETYAGSLPAPEIRDIVARAEPLSDFVTYRFPADLRRRYEYLARFPKNYLVFGDALCSFNPVYGQGMTVAALEALSLQACLRKGAADLARRFFRATKKTVDTPWDIAVGNDLRHPQVEGPRSPKVKFINWYIGKLHMAAHDDATLANDFLRVANLMASPQSLLSPSVAMRVIRGNLSKRSAEDARTVHPGVDAWSAQFKAPHSRRS